MRTGGYTLPQALTADAARVVNQAVTLARCRGHAQVTPLHVANTMLAASAGLFRTACLQSHSHPLQCKALELCFNVALNRLPASSASPMLGTNSQHPSISNALVAAFKRAQAHQRRGSIENQQQPLLAVKIELEQLIISILDDPSVSRVMREAGFSSTQVKSNVEQAVSLEICSQPPSPSSKSKGSNQLSLLQSQPVGQSGTKIDKPVASDLIKNEDVRSVIDHLMNKRRKSTVIVGECLDNLENTVRGVMNKVDKGDVPETLRKVNFIQVTLSSFGHRSRVDVEQTLGELKSVVKSCLNKEVVLYLGDLNWVTDYRASSTEQERGRYYCPVEHMIVELGKLISGIGEPGSFWLMGIATFQTYMRCKSSGHPSLEAVWGLHPLTIPAASLGLSLITAGSTDLQSQSTSKKTENGNSSLLLEGGQEQQQHLACCTECSAKFDMEAQSLQSSTCNSVSTTSSQLLPAWLRQYKHESKGFISNDKNYVPVRDHLCKKWNSICSSIHKQPHSSEKTARTFSSLSPSSSTSCFSHDRPYPNLHQIIHHEWPVAEPKNSWRHHRIWISEDSNVTVEPRLIMGIPENGDSKQPFSSNPNSTPNSPSSSEVMMETEYSHRFKELSAENMKTLCSALEKKVPWQKDIIPELANTILQCRSGMARRKGMARNNELKEETWLFFQGADTEAKEKIARELAKLIFGSQRCLISIAMSTFSSTRADSSEDCKNKRSREEKSCSYIERFAEAVSTNPHMVFLVEDVEQADYFSQMGFKRAIERGRIANCDGEEVDLSDAIIILSCESFSSRSRACSPPIKQKSEGSEDQKGAALEETSPCMSLDLNISIDDDCAADQSIDEIGLLETVDKRFYFKIQEL
ncbi:protein SMAX1-LIKE 3-like [Juglans microcarpa x Juglans regia]|uniref:protein SMAX1-LIKE 3-like n=1 Tax=Juglans microcarpa x Juglans regia TaxID=2249226 RepID=UPI001B7DC8C6|nr:protein SMAX1-LIKE 3-like [Juglans microcarpa x Juglans regia]